MTGRWDCWRTRVGWLSASPLTGGTLVIPVHAGIQLPLHVAGALSKFALDPRFRGDDGALGLLERASLLAGAGTLVIPAHAGIQLLLYVAGALSKFALAPRFRGDDGACFRGDDGARFRGDEGISL